MNSNTLDSATADAANAFKNHGIVENDNDYGTGQLAGRLLSETSCTRITEQPYNAQQVSTSLNQRECASGQSALPLIGPGRSDVADDESPDYATMVLNTANQHGEPPLHIAALEDNTELLRHLLSDIPADQPVFNDSLLNAAKKGQTQYLDTLVKAGANNLDDALRAAAGEGQVQCLTPLKKLGAKDLDGALRKAAAQGQTMCLKPLKKLGAEDLNGALREAAEQGKLQCLKPLINLGARNYDDALCAAAQQGHTNSLLFLINEGAKDFNSALYYAVLAKNEESKNILLTKGADMTSLLHTAARKNSMECLDDPTFLTLVDINATDKNGRTPLHIAAAMGHIESLEKLIDTNGVNLDITNKLSQSALHIAVINNDAAAVKLLLAAGINVNKGCFHYFTDQHIDYCTALHLAAMHADIKIVELLIKAGIEVDATSGYNRTALHTAAQHADVDVIKLLMQHIQVNEKNNSGYTPLHMAANDGRKDAVDALLTAEDININAKTNKGIRPIDLAKDSECKAALQAFEKANKHKHNNKC
ncbi:ankyrin repeat domain-containing protein [Endozoicomonas sp. ALC013]|uniref:ankyrin repeat domain-containing protein n=1 Tax=Endozoicomonas sp. ALC013 TaxID=3403076 RepID=UPI003BB66E1C